MKNKINSLVIYPFVFVAIVFIIYLIIILYNVWPIDSKTLTQAATLGDSFGALTSLFSGLAFAGIIVTIWQQKYDLELTREEIRNQHFENVLFKMIEIHNLLVSDIDLRKKQIAGPDGISTSVIIASGRDCFSILYKELEGAYRRNYEKNGEDENYLSEVYIAFFENHNQDLGHYFRYLYNIFKFIDDSDIVHKKIYSNIVRAQLSDYEILLLFYNGTLSSHSNFKFFIEKYSLLDNINLSKLIEEKHKEFYLGSAYE